MSENKNGEQPKLITDHAGLGCNYAQPIGTPEKDWNRTYIHFTHSHGIEQGEDEYAHDDDCIAIKNVGCFRKCYSPYYSSALLAIRNAAEAEIQENKIAASMPGGFKRCMGRYLNEWFDADDSTIMYSYVNDCEDLVVRLENIKKEVRKYKNEVYDCLGIDVYKREYYAANYDSELYEKVKGYGNQIDTTIRGMGDLADCITIFNEDFKQPQNVITGIINSLNSLLHYMKNIKEAITGSKSLVGKNIPDYSEVKAAIEKIIPDLKDAQSDLKNWVPKERHLITTESYLVCKCGGFVKVLDDGQGYVDTFDRIVTATEDLIILMKEYCQEWLDGWHSEEFDDRDPTVKEERINSEQAMAKINDLMNGKVNELTDNFYDTVFLEFWSHAYFEEIESQTIGILSLVSVFAPPYIGVPLAIGLTLYQYSKKDGSEPVDVTALNDILTMYRGYINYYAKCKEYVKLCTGLAKVNDIASFVTAIPCLIYTSNATWIEQIRITIFTDRYAVVGTQYLNQDGSKKGTADISRPYIFDYTAPGSPGYLLFSKWEGSSIYDNSYVFYPENME